MGSLICFNNENPYILLMAYPNYDPKESFVGYGREVIINPNTLRILGLQRYDPIYVTMAPNDEFVDNLFETRLLNEQVLLELKRMNTYLSLIVGEIIKDADINNSE